MNVMWSSLHPHVPRHRSGGCFRASHGLKPAVWFDSLNVGGHAVESRNSPIFCHSTFWHFSASFAACLNHISQQTSRMGLPSDRNPITWMLNCICLGVFFVFKSWTSAWKHNHTLHSNLNLKSEAHSPCQTPLMAGCEGNLSPPAEPWNTRDVTILYSDGKEKDKMKAKRTDCGTCRGAALSCPRTQWSGPVLKCPAANHNTDTVSMWSESHTDWSCTGFFRDEAGLRRDKNNYQFFLSTGVFFWLLVALWILQKQ